MVCNKSFLQVVPEHSSVLYTETILPPPRYSFGAAGRPGTGSQRILALVHWCQEISAGVLTCFKADTPLPQGPRDTTWLHRQVPKLQNMEKCLRDL